LLIQPKNSRLSLEIIEKGVLSSLNSYKDILEKSSKINQTDISKLNENILEEIRNGSIDMQQLDKSLTREWKNSFAYQRELQRTLCPYELFRREWHIPTEDRSTAISDLYVKDVTKICFELDYVLISPSNIEAYRRSDFYNKEIEYMDLCDYPDIFSTIPIITIDEEMIFNARFICHNDGTTVILPFNHLFVYTVDEVTGNKTYNKHNVRIEIIENSFVQCYSIPLKGSGGAEIEQYALAPALGKYSPVATVFATNNPEDIEDMVKVEFDARMNARYCKKYGVASVDVLPADGVAALKTAKKNRWSIITNISNNTDMHKRLSPNGNIALYVGLQDSGKYIYKSSDFTATDSHRGTNIFIDMGRGGDTVTFYNSPGTLERYEKSERVSIFMIYYPSCDTTTSETIYTTSGSVVNDNHVYDLITTTAAYYGDNDPTRIPAKNATHCTLTIHTKQQSDGDDIKFILNRIPVPIENICIGTKMYMTTDVKPGVSDIISIPEYSTFAKYSASDFFIENDLGHLCSKPGAFDDIIADAQKLKNTYSATNVKFIIYVKAFYYNRNIDDVGYKEYATNNICKLILGVDSFYSESSIGSIEGGYDKQDFYGYLKLLLANNSPSRRTFLTRLLSQYGDQDDRRLSLSEISEILNSDNAEVNKIIQTLLYSAALPYYMRNMYSMEYNAESDVRRVKALLDSTNLENAIATYDDTLDRYKYQLYKLYELGLANPDAYMRVVLDQVKFRDNVMTLGFYNNTSISGDVDRISFDAYIASSTRTDTLYEFPDRPFRFAEEMVFFVIDSNLMYPDLMELRIFIDGFLITDYYKDRTNLYEYVYIPRRYFKENSVIEIERFDSFEYTQNIEFVDTSTTYEVELPDTPDTLPVNVSDIMFETDTTIEKVVKSIPTRTQQTSKILKSGAIKLDEVLYEVYTYDIPKHCNMIDLTMQYDIDSAEYLAVVFFDSNDKKITSYDNLYFNPLEEVRKVHTKVPIPDNAKTAKITNYLPATNVYSMNFLIRYESNANARSATLIPVSNFEITTEYDRLLKKSGVITSPAKKLNKFYIRLKTEELAGSSFIFKIYKKPKSIRFISTVNGHPSVGIGTALQKKDIDHLRVFKNGRLMPQDTYRIDRKYRSFVLTFLDRLSIGDKIFIDITPYKYTCVAYNKDFIMDNATHRRRYNIYKDYGTAIGNTSSWKDVESVYSASVKSGVDEKSIFYNLPLDFSLEYYDVYVNGRKLSRFDFHRVDSENAYITTPIIYNSHVQIFQKDISLESRWDKSIFAYIKHVRDERVLNATAMKPVCMNTIHHYKNQDQITPDILRSAIDMYNYDNIPIGLVGPFSSTLLTQLTGTKYDGVITYKGKKYTLDKYIEFTLIGETKLMTPNGQDVSTIHDTKPEYNIEDVEIVDKSVPDFYWGEILPKKAKDPNTNQFNNDKMTDMYQVIMDNYQPNVGGTVIDLNPDKYLKHIAKQPNLSRTSPYVVFPLGHTGEIHYPPILNDNSVVLAETKTPYYKQK
jgi:hypothetical protein